MPNDYVGLMQMLQAPGQQRQQKQNEALLGLAKIGYQALQMGERNKTQADIKTRIADAEKKGEKVEYKVDPDTGMISPVFQSKPSIDPAQMTALGYEASGVNAKGGVTYSKKKKYKPEQLAIAKQILKYGSDGSIKTKIGGQEVDLDPNSVEGIDKAMDLAYGADWQKDEELKDFVPIYNERVKTIGDKATTDAKLKAEKNKPMDWTGLKEAIGKIGKVALAPAEMLNLISKFEKKSPEQSKVKTNFNAGDIKEKAGVKYIRDANGSWHPVGE